MVHLKPFWCLAHSGDSLNVQYNQEISTPLSQHVHLPCTDCPDTHGSVCARNVELVQQVDEDDAIYHVISPTLGTDPKPQDFVILASRRKPCDHGDPYVIALRSVTLPTHPETPEYRRGETLCSGFCVWREGDQMTKVSYYNQATSGFLNYVTTNVAGLSLEFYNTFKACEKFLLDNRNDLAPSLQTL